MEQSPKGCCEYASGMSVKTENILFSRSQRRCMLTTRIKSDKMTSCQSLFAPRLTQRLLWMLTCCVMSLNFDDELLSHDYVFDDLLSIFLLKCFRAVSGKFFWFTMHLKLLSSHVYKPRRTVHPISFRVVIHRILLISISIMFFS